MIRKLNEPKAAAGLFEGWQETAISSALGRVMGSVYAEDEDPCRSAMVILGDFCFLGGEPNLELVRYFPEDRQSHFIIMVPQSMEWGRMIEEVYGESAAKCERYAICKDGDRFDRDALRTAAASLPEGYSLRMIDADIYARSRAEEWSADWTSQYTDYAMYEKQGLGVAALYGNEIVAGASSYYPFPGGIEIQIDTRMDHRRKGLAYACGAALILECLKRGLYPSWDAQNRESVGLAMKLGYRYDHAYDAYEVSGYGK